jgi:hypothetical protein
MMNSSSSQWAQARSRQSWETALAGHHRQRDVGDGFAQASALFDPIGCWNE